MDQERPWSVYELHHSSWRRVVEEGNRPLTYREMAPVLADYVCELGFTHVASGPMVRSSYHADRMAKDAGFVA